MWHYNTIVCMSVEALRNLRLIASDGRKDDKKWVTWSDFFSGLQLV